MGQVNIMKVNVGSINVTERLVGSSIKICQ